ncbi:IS66 family transposase [Actinoallomurus purpureus]|uniref:IS66 family transposase n=1 Tax=Actinoallomurus purpureus TaxID=478114 RepID=UPI00355629D6
MWPSSRWNLAIVESSRCCFQLNDGEQMRRCSTVRTSLRSSFASRLRWHSASAGKCVCARRGVRATAARASNREKDHNALARRLLDKHDDHLRFTIDARVPFDNSAAEREIRMIKIRQ